MKVQGTLTIKGLHVTIKDQQFSMEEFTLNYETDLGELIEKLLSDPSIIQMLEQSANDSMQALNEEILNAMNN